MTNGEITPSRTINKNNMKQTQSARPYKLPHISHVRQRRSYSQAPAIAALGRAGHLAITRAGRGARLNYFRISKTIF